MPIAQMRPMTELRQGAARRRKLGSARRACLRWLAVGRQLSRLEGYALKRLPES